MKFCKDCKFSRREAGMPMEVAKCAHPDLIKYDPVDGQINTWCRTERRDFGSLSSKCGPDGNLWEQFEPGMNEACVEYKVTRLVP